MHARNADCCDRWSLSVVCLSFRHEPAPCKNGWTDPHHVWVETPGGQGTLYKMGTGGPGPLRRGKVAPTLLPLPPPPPTQLYISKISFVFLTIQPQKLISTSDSSSVWKVQFLFQIRYQFIKKFLFRFRILRNWNCSFLCQFQFSLSKISLEDGGNLPAVSVRGKGIQRGHLRVTCTSATCYASQISNRSTSL